MFRLSVEQRTLLDLLRALAAAEVLSSHLRHFVGLSDVAPGWGVTVFFLLSGFLIDQTAGRAAASGQGFKSYFIDRTTRIFVCYVPALFFTAAISAQMIHWSAYPGDSGSGPYQLIGNLLLLQDYPAFQILRRLGIDSAAFIKPYAFGEQYWTLPIEYFICIGYGLLHFGLVSKLRRSLVGVVVAIFIGIVMLYNAATGFGQCLTLTWFLGVAISRVLARPVLPAWLGVRSERVRNRPALRCVIVFISLAAALLVLRMISRGAIAYDLQKNVFAALLLLGFLWLAPELGALRKSMVTSLSAYFAKTSYALYLTHNIVIAAAVMWLGSGPSLRAMAMLAVACYFVAFVFWFLFDRHYKTLASYLKKPGSEPLGAGRP